MNPTVSIGLPVAQEKITYVRDAIRSVQNQSLTNWELIVVADGSPRTTRDYLTGLTDPRIHVFLHAECRGLGARLNEIADLARGEFLARMDADDIMHPERLERQVSILRENPGTDLVACRAVVIDEQNVIMGVTPPVPPTVTPASMLASTPFIHPTVIARTVWWKSHRYDTQLLRSQDKALWIVSARDSCLVRDDQILLFYRVKRALDPVKYACSARFERVIIRHFGPDLVGCIPTLRTLLSSLTKQNIILAASKLGQTPRIISRRYICLNDQELLELATLLEQALAPVNSTSPSLFGNDIGDLL